MAASRFVARFPLPPGARSLGCAQAPQDDPFLHFGARRATRWHIGSGGRRRRDVGEVWRSTRRPFRAAQRPVPRPAEFAG